MDSVALIAILTALSGLLAAVGVAVLFRKVRDPRKREQRRRQTVSRLGRMGDGTITEFHDGVIFFGYVLSGVEYTASQDVTQLMNRLPADPHSVVGPVTIKYLARNPANSIVVSEDWAGFRSRPAISKGA